jgi:enhancer of polycomb-like protein
VGVVPMMNGIPISVQRQMKKIQPPTAAAQLRISSNGGMRPPATPVISSIRTQSSPPHPPPLTQPNGINGANQSPSRAPENEVVKVEVVPTLMPNGTLQSQHDANASSLGHSIFVSSRLPSKTSPVRLKSSQGQHLMVPIQNDYHIASMNGFSALPNGSIYHPNGQHNGLSVQQMQNLKSVFANRDMNTVNLSGSRGLATPYMGQPVLNGALFNMRLGAGANMNLKLPPAQQPQ